MVWQEHPFPITRRVPTAPRSFRRCRVAVLAFVVAVLRLSCLAWLLSVPPAFAVLPVVRRRPSFRPLSFRRRPPLVGVGVSVRCSNRRRL